MAYFVSGRALKPLHTFASRVENVQPNNLTDMKITDDVPAEFKQFSISFNQMLDRLDEGFTAQRQFTGNAAHELRTPLALLQAQLELFLLSILIWMPKVPTSSNYCRNKQGECRRLQRLCLK